MGERADSQLLTLACGGVHSFVLLHYFRNSFRITRHGEDSNINSETFLTTLHYTESHVGIKHMAHPIG
jgi:hypothetical protein